MGRRKAGLAGMSLAKPSADGGLVQAMAGFSGVAVTNVALADLADNPRNPSPRTSRDLGEVIPTSVATLGLLSPVIAQPAQEWIAENPEFADQVGERTWVVIDGHRRLAAAKAAGLESVPVWPKRSGVSDTRVRLHTSLTPLALTPIQEAQGFRHVIDHEGYTQRGIAEELGINSSVVTRRLKLLRLPPALASALDEDKIDLNRAQEAADLPKATLDDLATRTQATHSESLREVWNGLVAQAKRATQPLTPSLTVNSEGGMGKPSAGSAADVAGQERWNALIAAAGAKIGADVRHQVLATTVVNGCAFNRQAWALAFELLAAAGVSGPKSTLAAWRKALQHGSGNARSQGAWILSLAAMEIQTRTRKWPTTHSEKEYLDILTSYGAYVQPERGHEQ
jgi:ParB/RepB/Spo0J family partition protein